MTRCFHPRMSRPDEIYHATVMPCLDKKLEASREDFYEELHKTRDVDCVVTTHELEVLLLEQHVDLKQLPVVPPTPLPGLPSSGELYTHAGGGAVRFGGVERRGGWGGGGRDTGKGGDGCWSVLTLSRLLLGRVPGERVSLCGARALWPRGRGPLAVCGAAVCGLSRGDAGGGWQARPRLCFGWCDPRMRLLSPQVASSNPPQPSPTLPSPLTISQAHGFKSIQNVVRRMKRGKCAYHFVEVMACPRGCNNGGGQLKPRDDETPMALLDRVEALYDSLPLEFLEEEEEGGGRRSVPVGLFTSD